MHSKLLLISSFLIIGHFSAIEGRDGGRCVPADENHKSRTYHMRVYNHDIVRIVCRVSQPKEGWTLLVEHNGKKERASRIQTRIEVEMKINISTSNFCKELRCNYGYNGNYNYSRSVRFTMVNKTNASPKTECMIFEVPVAEESSLVRDSTLKNHDSEIKVNSKELPANDSSNATCEFQLESQGIDFEHGSADENSASRWYDTSHQWLWLMYSTVVIAIVIIIIFTSIYLKKRKKENREINEGTETIYASLTLKPNPHNEIRGDERAMYAEIVGVLKKCQFS